MFFNTLSHLKSLVKESFSLVKTVSVGTITAVKNDVCQIAKDVKDFKNFKEWQAQQNQQATATPNAQAREDENA